MKVKHLVLLLCLFALLTYIVPNYGEVRRVSVGPVELSIPSNVDSPDFVFLVTHFPAGFIDSNTRISRPLYVALGVLPYTLLKHIVPVPASVDRQVVQSLAGSERQELWADTSGREVVAAWISLLLVNFVVALFGLLLLVRGLQRAGWSEFQLFALFLVFASFKFDTQILVPHTELFDLLLPAYLFYLLAPLFAAEHGSLDNADQLPSEGIYTLHMAIIGVLFLGKAVLFLYLVALWGWFRLFGLRSLWKPAVLLPLFNVMYILALKVGGVEYYQHEAEVYRQGVWLMDAAAASGFPAAVYAALTTAVSIAYATVSTFAPEILIAAVLLVAGRASVNVMTQENTRFSPHELEFLAVYSVSFLGFWTLIGYYPSRLLFTFFPVVFMILAKLYREIDASRSKKLLVIIFCTYFLISFGTAVNVETIWS